jgi:Flp pilus assembly secretin CpaC
MRSYATPKLTTTLAAAGLFLMAALFVGFHAGLARAADLKVEVDQAKIVRLDRAGAEVIIGNPSIADVSVQSGRLLVVTGKSGGLTNIIVLDSAGRPVYDEKLFVTSDIKRLVTINKGVARETYSCAPECGPALVPGDANGFFEPLSKAIRSKLGIAQSAAEGTNTQE